MCFEVNQVQGEPEHNLIVVSCLQESSFSNLFTSRANTAWLWVTEHCWLVFYSDVFSKICSVPLSLSVSLSKAQKCSARCLFHHRDSHLGQGFYGKRAGCSGRHKRRRGDTGTGKGRGWMRGKGKRVKKTRVSTKFHSKQKNEGSGIHFQRMNAGVWLWLAISCQTYTNTDSSCHITSVSQSIALTKQSQ